MSAAAQRLGHVATAYEDVTRSRRYFPLWLGQLISTFGDTLHYISLVVLVFQLTGRGVAVAGLVVAEIVLVLLLGPVAGVVIDRFSRKWVLIAADLIRAGLTLSLVWLQGVWHLWLGSVAGCPRPDGGLQRDVRSIRCGRRGSSRNRSSQGWLDGLDGGDSRLILQPRLGGHHRCSASLC